MAQTADAVKAGATPGGMWLARLGRRTTSGEFIPVIDGLRFVAISLVLMLHVLTGLWVRDPSGVEATGFDVDWVLPGQHGVHLFFVISGLILGIAFARRAKGGPLVGLRRFYLRRLSRLEPPYLLAFTGFFIINPLFGYGSFEDLTPHYISGLFYAHGLVYRSVNPVSEVTWAVEVEFQFYLVMPLLATVFLVDHAGVRRRLLAAAIIAATGLAHVMTIGQPASNVAGEPFPLAALSLPGYLNLFLLGMLVADLYVHEGWDRRRPSVTADLAFVAGMAGLFITPLSYGPGRTLLLPLACVLVVGGGIRGRLARWLLERPVIFLIGGMSYSIYLLHFGIVRLIGDPVTDGITFSSPTMEFLTGAVLLTGACLIAAVAFYLLIERPCMRPDWPLRVQRWIRELWQEAQRPR